MYVLIYPFDTFSDIEKAWIKIMAIKSLGTREAEYVYTVAMASVVMSALLNDCKDKITYFIDTTMMSS